MTKLLAERTVASDARMKLICLRPQRMSQRTSTRTAREKEVEFVRLKRLLAIPAAAALVAGAALLVPAGIASASTAGTASASSVAATAAAAQQPSVHPATVTLAFGGYYSDSLECAISGAGHIGLVLSGGVVIDYECFYNGEPGPLGPYELWLFVQSLSCSSATQAVTSGVSPQRPVC